MHAVKHVGLLLSLSIVACSSSGVPPRDGASVQDAAGGAGGDGGTDPVHSGDGEITLDANPMDRSADTASDSRFVDLSQDSRDAVDDTPGSVDGKVAVDVQPVDIGSGEGGVVACVVGGACAGQTGCSSGDDVDIGCRLFLLCQNGSLRSRTAFSRCGTTSGMACPATQPVQGAACSLHAQTCSYVTGTCTCANGCEGGIDAGPCPRPTTWHCDAPPPTGCPMQAPQLGVPCSNGTASCTYGNSCAGYQVACQNGYWQPYGLSPLGGCG